MIALNSSKHLTCLRFFGLLFSMSLHPRHGTLVVAMVVAIDAPSAPNMARNHVNLGICLYFPQFILVINQLLM